MSDFKNAFLEAAKSALQDRKVPAPQADHGEFVVTTVDIIKFALAVAYPHHSVRAELDGPRIIILADEDDFKKDDTFAVDYAVAADGSTSFVRSYDFSE